jgi:hypothetical protein
VAGYGLLAEPGVLPRLCARAAADEGERELRVALVDAGDDAALAGRQGRARVPGDRPARRPGLRRGRLRGQEETFGHGIESRCRQALMHYAPLSDESTEIRFVAPDEIERLPMHHTQRLRITHYLEKRDSPHLG